MDKNDYASGHIKNESKVPGQYLSDLPMTKAYLDVLAERIRQEELKAAGKFLWSCADNTFTKADGTVVVVTEAEKCAVLGEEVGEVAKEVVELIIGASKDPGTSGAGAGGFDYEAGLALIRKELIQVAAVCVGWVESLDARGVK